jgi:hypothetical protein
MASNDELKFRLKGKDFEEIHPDIRFSNLNAMAFVSRIQNETPSRIEIEFDGNPESMLFLSELAGEVGYFANIEGNRASFERV